jgi:magnesium chelatase family protein
MIANSTSQIFTVYKTAAHIDIHCEIQAVPFAQLSQMQPGEPSAAIRERVFRARTIADLAGSEKVESMHIAEAIGYRNLDRGDWAERGI